MKTQSITNQFGIQQTLVNMTIEEMKSKEVVNESNFFDCTVANWKESDVEFKADYVSDSGFEYMYTTEGVYRKSDHWNHGVSTCIWQLNGDCVEKETIAFCSWSDFKKYSSKRKDGYRTLQSNIQDMLIGKMVLSHRIGNII